MTRFTFASVSLVAAITACTPSQVGDDPGTSPDASDIGPPGEPEECPAVNFTATAVVPSISLLIDRSGSMADPIGNKTRYAAVRDALVEPTNGVVSTLEARAYFGASLYSTDAPCPKLYSVPRAMNNRNAIATLINGQAPAGNTPTGPSIDQAVAAFAADPPPVDSPPVIVLATDGLPNGCNGGDGEAASIAASAASYAAGVRLYVLAVGNGINDSHLQKVANAGAGVAAGQPNAKFYVANTPTELRTAFEDIIGGVTSCELSINGTIDESQAMNGTVTLNGTPLTYGSDWELVNGNVVRLLGQACTSLKSSTNPVVNASFPCGAVLL
ncbi:MAG: VWA domain-containing protein [Deltaproteobacteria bacterium]|nr:VWA domain-containing protein [Deltaproteobacteria bacterium]